MKSGIILIVIGAVLAIDGIINIVLGTLTLVAAIDFVVGLPLLWWGINRIAKARRIKVES